MATSVLLRGLTRRAQISSCLSPYESVFRNVNTPMIPWAGFMLGNSLNLGSRALCSKPDHSGLAAENETKILSVSNPTKIVFKYVCANDKPKKNSKYFKIRKIIEPPTTPTGDSLFELNKRGDRIQPMSNFFRYVVGIYMEAAELFSGRRVSVLSVIIPPLFNLDLRRLLAKAEAVYGFNVGGVIADDEKTDDSISRWLNSNTKIISIPSALDGLFLNRIQEIIRRGDKIVINSSTGCIKLTLDLNDFLEIRIWEIVTNGDKTVLEIIVSELRRNGFDITEDPLALRKVEQAVERAIARGSNTIKLNLPVTYGPEMSATVSWGTSDYFYARCYP